MGRVEVELTLDFRRGGNAERHLVTGWHDPECDFTWTDGPASEIWLPTVPGANGLLLEVLLRPLRGPRLHAQRLGIFVNGTEIAQTFVQAELTHVFDVPRAVLDDAAATLVRFEQPDARTVEEAGGAAADPRVLGFAFRHLSLRAAPSSYLLTEVYRPPLRAADIDALATLAKGCTGLALPALASSFESLGHNCEFGLVQRRLGAEPISLLRFSGITPQDLLRGLRERFDGLTTPSNLRLETVNAEGDIMIRERLYGIDSHSFERRGVDEVALLRQAERRLPFLLRLFQETAVTGSRIFVFQAPLIHTEAAVRPIAAALHAMGPATLLWVSADSTRQPGSVRLVRPGILHGVVAYLAPFGRAGDSDLASWISILANAYRLSRESGWNPAPQH